MGPSKPPGCPTWSGDAMTVLRLPQVLVRYQLCRLGT
eukprot:gene26624-biopygen17023